MYLKRKFKKGFTLIELIIAIAVIGTMSGFATVSYGSYKETARKQERDLAVQQVKNAVDNYYHTYKKYPTAPIEKQPSQDVVDASGNITFRGFSEVDLELLISSRYLQSKPELEDDEFFAVSYAGNVTIEAKFSESVVINDGSVIVNDKTGKLSFKVFTDKKLTVSSIVVVEKSNKNKSYNLALSSANDGVFTDTNVPVSNTPGKKDFSTSIRYNSGKVVTINSSIQYAVNTEALTGDVYWAPNKSNNVVLTNSEVKSSTNAGVPCVSIDWSNREVVSKAPIVKYSIKKFVDGVETLDSPIVTDKLFIDDKNVKGSSTYRYEVSAVAASGKATSNVLIASNVVTTNYTDNMSNIDVLTKNNFETARSIEVAAKAFDKEGIKRVTLHLANVKQSNIESIIKNPSSLKFKTYEMYEAKDSTSTSDEFKDVYTVPVSVEDDYMLYFVEVTDLKGYKTYAYYDSSLKKDIVSKDKSILEKKPLDNTYTLMRGLVKIYEDHFLDEEGIDKSKSEITVGGKKIKGYHIFDSKITLP